MPDTPPLTPAKSTKASIPLKIKLLSSIVSFLECLSIRSNGSVNRRLLSLLDLQAPPHPKPVNGVATSDHTVDSSLNLSIRLFSPTSSSSFAPPLPVIVYFHGGGFTFHSAFTRAYDALCCRLSSHIPARVVSVNYRLAPEHRYPVAYEDGVKALQWLDSSTNLIADLSTVFIAGDSAGGNIAHHVTRMAQLESSSFKRLSVVGAILIQPFFGGEHDTESERELEGVPFGSRKLFKWMWRSFLPEGSSLDHEAANVFGPGSKSDSEDWAGFPKTMVVIGGYDTLQDRQRWYCKGLRKAGVDVCVAAYAGAVHGFFVFSETQEAKQFMADLKDFVQKRSEGCRGHEVKIVI